MDKNLGSEQIKRQRRSLLSYAKGNILEIGVGTGNNLELYPRNITEITAVDCYVRGIKSPSVTVKLYPYSCEQLLFEDNSFDTVVARSALAV